MSIKTRTFSRRSRTRRANPAGFVFTVAGVAIAAVVVLSALGVLQGPDRAVAASGNLPQGAIGIGTTYAPSAGPVTGAQKVADARTAQAEAFGAAVAKKQAYDRKLAAKKAAAKRAAARRAAAKRAAAKKAALAKAMKRIHWRTAVCSTFGIGDGGLGQPLAGGGHLRSNSMIVAHKSLPFGTKIRFKYHGRTCIAIVKDRGPYIGGRTFDLGPGTAKKLHFGGVGTVKWAIVKH